MRRINDAQLHNWGSFVLRMVVGVVFVAHGGQKLFSFGLDGTAGFMEQVGVPFPYASAVAATFSELLGGIALIAGFYTRIAAIPLAFTMVVAAATVHLKGGFFLPEGFEYTFTLFGASVALVMLGSGELSVASLTKKRGTNARNTQQSGGTNRAHDSTT